MVEGHSTKIYHCIGKGFRKEELFRFLCFLEAPGCLSDFVSLCAVEVYGLHAELFVRKESAKS